MASDLLGWLSSAILLLTIGAQLHKQWQSRSAAGVSRWLFVGQMAASLGFTIYSAVLENWVFVVTNALMLLSAILGAVLTAHFKRRAAAGTHSAKSPASRCLDETKTSS